MKLSVVRDPSAKDFTTGMLYVNGRFQCFTLEDERRTTKVHGETRIPAGEYVIKLRTVGGFHEKYSKKFGATHKGMLWLQDVPGFEYILIHVGNTDKDTAGCILVGATVDRRKGVLGRSTEAYRSIYPVVAAAILGGERVTIEVRD